MNQIAVVKIEDSCRVDRFLAVDLEMRAGERCIVTTDRGTELGVVKSVEPDEKAAVEAWAARRVLRKATPKDMAQYTRKRSREEKAQEICRQFVRKHKLVMKLTRVECLYDGSKIVFYYTADGRVDFRGLVKDLASTLKTRIEMRQIGVRDEARLLGGVGCCGLSLCCATWLRGFKPVSIRIAKKQCMNLNPSRLSGVCGRLMCCLMYESEPKAGPAPVEETDLIEDGRPLPDAGEP